MFDIGIVMSKDDKFLDRVESAKKAVHDYKKWLASNQLNLDEDSVVYIDEKKKAMSTDYTSDEGSFKVSVIDKGLNSKISAETKFGELTFRAIITKNGTKKDGTPPVYNEHWSMFHSVFLPRNELS